MMGSAVSGGWKSYDVVGQHMDISDLFLNNFI
jgi:hypothetical protein